MVSGDDVGGALDMAVTLRQPVFAEDMPTRARVPVLEGYIALTAFWQGELAQARLEAHRALRTLEREWRALQGWEMLRHGKTDASIESAKARLAPELHEAILAQRWLIARLGEEYERMESEATRAGRRYTLLTGA